MVLGSGPPKWAQLPLNWLKGSTEHPQYPHRVCTARAPPLILPLKRSFACVWCSSGKQPLVYMHNQRLFWIFALTWDGAHVLCPIFHTV